MRLFVAIDIPDAVRQQLSALQSDVPNVRWVPAANLHCTVRFVGEVDVGTARSIVQAVNHLAIEPFDMHVRRVGHFPLSANAGMPAVLWAGVEPSKELQGLVTNVENAVVHCGIKPEQRPFHGHVTLARCGNTTWPDVTAWCHRHHHLDAGMIRVSHVRCYRSIQTHSGTQYQQV